VSGGSIMDSDTDDYGDARELRLGITYVYSAEVFDVFIDDVMVSDSYIGCI
jgi:hypothetical protein